MKPLSALLAVLFSTTACQLLAAPAPTAAPPAKVDLATAAGVKWQFKPEGGDWKPINVPAGGWRAQGYKCDAGTYRATLALPQGVEGKTVRVAFAAVNFGADVSAGPDFAHLTKVASHVNGWMPFNANITRFAKSGAKVALQVDVKGRKKFMVNGKYTVPEGATWYEGLAEGILRGVRLEVLPKVRIDNAWVKTRVSPDQLRAAVTIVNDTAKPVTVKLGAALSSALNAKFAYPKLQAQTAQVPANGATTVEFGPVLWELGPESYWWPNVPYQPGYKAQLHNLSLTLSAAGKPLDTYRQRFGFRQFAVAGNHYELNGVRCNLRGDNQQEANFGTDAYGIKPGFGAPTASNPGWPKAVDNLLRLNFNVMRIHQIPPTPYMLSVCDELGLMIVGESPLRGSEGGEDYKAGKDYMLAMDREMVLRDRNHPAIVIWSAANEFTEPIKDAVEVINQVDGTRPIIADGIGDIGAPYINMQHYVKWNDVPMVGGSPRDDRPYGETEAVWPLDNTWQGFAWMATGVRVRRLKGNADLRNYVLNNAWPNYVPGEGPDTEVLEVKVKNMGTEKTIHPALTDPWNHPNIKLMQQCYHPTAACDVDFDRANARSNAKGEWPVVKPRLIPGKTVTRQIAIFNDEFSGSSIDLRWELHQGSATGPIVAKGSYDLMVSLGEFYVQDLSFDCPKTPGDHVLVLKVYKAGKLRFTEDKITYTVLGPGMTLIPDGEYKIVSRNSGLPLGPATKPAGKDTRLAQVAKEGGDELVWQVKNTGNDNLSITNKATGLALTAIEAGDPESGLEPADGQQHQIWRLVIVDEGYYCLLCPQYDKVLDVFGASGDAGARVLLWGLNNGNNQQWEFVPAK